MKILQINKFYYLRGGAERYYFGLSELLEKNGHQVVPFAMQDENNNQTPYAKYFTKKFNVEKFNLLDIFKSFYNWEAARKLERLILAEKPDIAHLHNIAYQLTPSIIYVLKKYNILVIQTLHDYKLICPNYKLFSQNKACFACKKRRYYQCVKKKCVKNSYLKSLLATLEMYLHKTILKSYDKVDLFIAPSIYLKNVCVDFGINPQKIVVVNNFIENRSYANAEIEDDYILYFGRISEEKGIDVLIKAMEKTEGMKLKIAGAGPETERLKRIIHDYDLEKKIEFIGLKYGLELEGIVNKSKAIIVPSIWPENFPFSILESLERGKVIIASRIGGIPELIQNDVNGFLFEPGDHEGLSQIIKTLKTKDLMAIKEAARNSAQKYASRRHLEGILAIYGEIKNLLTLKAKCDKLPSSNN